MNKLITLMTSAALTVLIGATGAYAESNRRAPDATYGQQDRGTAIDTQATGEEGISGPRVKVKPGDVIDGGRVIGADPDPFIRDHFCANTTRDGRIDRSLCTRPGTARGLCSSLIHRPAPAVLPCRT